MNVDRTIKLKPDMSEEDMEALRQTMIYKGNRKGNSFKCVKCEFSLHADLNAARNIAIPGRSEDSRLTINQPYIACDDAEAHKGFDAEHSNNALHLSAQ